MKCQLQKNTFLFWRNKKITWVLTTACAVLISIKYIYIPLFLISKRLIDNGVIPNRFEYLFAVGFSISALAACNGWAFEKLFRKIVSFRPPATQKVKTWTRN